MKRLLQIGFIAWLLFHGGLARAENIVVCRHAQRPTWIIS
jgi:hypothetical protein